MFSLLSVYRAPQVTLTAEGHPMFVYAKPCSGEVIMTESGKFDYFFSDDDAPSDEDVAFDGLELPPALVDYISTYGA
ncbi:hypothetical protein NX02_21475 [Sphingomonas sanxanigenens DSM 19645 = NX02]|uniref:Uncharacterized protein n=1 Tax=Sphingomonas sanxanigenens DSM 19645 = NX02 TaxID=1123269 RepID=W0AH97_9SPHN|nr:hypothetical protein NX02_21475 [Sphingomonas sanxanigenens DSM 19645 = NX02]